MAVSPPVANAQASLPASTRSVFVRRCLSVVGTSAAWITDRVDSEVHERTVDPETEVAGFIDRMIDSSGKVTVQILDQQPRVRRLREILVISLAEIYADLPAAPGDIDPGIYMLTRNWTFVHCVAW